MRRCNEFYDRLNAHGIFLPADVALQAMQALHDVCVSWIMCSVMWLVGTLWFTALGLA